MELIQLNKNKILSTIKTLDPKECKLLVYLAAEADQEDLVDVVLSKVVDNCGFNKGTVSSILKSLREKGFVFIEKPLSNGRGHKYRISMNDNDIKEHIQEKLF